MLFASIIISSISQILLILFVYLKGTRNLTNILFSLIGASSVAWALTSYLSVISLNNEGLLDIVRFIFFFVVIQNTFFYMFARTFPDSTWRHSKRWLTAYLLFSICAASVTLSPLMITGVTVEDDILTTRPGPGMLIFASHAMLSIGYAFHTLVKKLRKSKGVAKRQIRILIVASILVWIVVPITNSVVTSLLKTAFFVELSPVYTFIFTGIIAYAIISQKLFDIRAALARSVGFVLSMGFIGIVYGVVTFGMLSWLELSLSKTWERFVFIGLALVTALMYPYAKGFFERITTRLFYKDIYDPQKFLNDLNDILVQKIEIEPLLNSVSKIINSNLKSSYSSFVIRKTAYKSVRKIGDSLALDDDQLATIKELTPALDAKVIVLEHLPKDSNVLRRFMDRNDIEVIIRLVPNFEFPTEGLGHVLLGPKLNGESYTRNDVAILEIVANELVIAIENGMRFEEIENFNSTLQAKVDNATKQLKRTNDKLQALDETKDEFISMASHQLRTPLTSVKGYVSMVLEGDAGPLNDMQRKLLEQSFTSSQRMVYLIADLLNLSRLKTGRFVIENVPSNLADVIEGEVSQLKETAAGKKMKLTYKTPKNFPTYMLDETKIRQVIMNFVDNAIYYTPAGGKIEINLVEKDKTIEFTVKDNGIGVPDAEQHHLFNKFYRAKNAQKARPDGTGLGLFMAKKVIVAQGGALIFHSTVGKGSTFGFSFAKSKLAKPPTNTEK